MSLPTQTYVYLHRNPRTLEIKYVGAGSSGRAWAYGWSSKGGPRRGNRTEEHQEWLSSLFESGYTMGDIVVIIAQGLSHPDALTIEREEIQKYNIETLFNKEMGISLLSLNDEQIHVAKQMRKDGWSYKSISEKISSSTMTVYKLLNGRTKNYV